MVLLIQKISRFRFALVTSIAILIYESGIQKVNAEEVDWAGLCEEFFSTSRCQEMPPKVIKVQLDRSGEDDEWIRIEKRGKTVELLHTTQVENGFVSGLFGVAFRLAPIPSPLVPKQHGWSDHQTTRVTFQPDNCSESLTSKNREKNELNCMVVGTNNLILPKGTDIMAGFFTVEYKENDLLRSITFRIPSEDEDD
jgi:hypothetical protein